MYSVSPEPLSRLEKRLFPSFITVGRWPNRGAPFAKSQLGERLVQRDLAGRGRQQVLPAQHMGDLHGRVVDGVDQRVERLPVGPHEHVVGHMLGLEGDLAPHQVVEDDRPVGHPQPQHRTPTLGQERVDLLLRQGAAVAVVARSCDPPCGPRSRRSSSSVCEQ